MTSLAEQHHRSAGVAILVGSGMANHDVVTATFNYADPDSILAAVKEACTDGESYWPETTSYHQASVSLDNEISGTLTVHLLSNEGTWQSVATG